MIDYYGYKYEADDNGNYNIIPNRDIIKPKTFFKYYALTENSVDALTNMYIYATHPNQFNDPFDCNEKLIEFNSWDDVEKFWGPYFDKVKDNYHDIDEACADCSYVYKTILYRKLGLISLSPVHDNYQMWALYAQNSGLCVEFDVNLFPFRFFGPFPINYIDDISSPIHIGKTGGSAAMLVQTNVKNKWWDYENEWRLYVPNPIGIDMKSFGPNAEKYNIFNEHDRKFAYSTSAIKSVYLGTSFFCNKHVIVNEISCYEKDVYCSDSNCLVNTLLYFLSNMQLMFDLRIYLAEMRDFSEYNFIPVVIARYKEARYRIITTSNINI